MFGGILPDWISDILVLAAFVLGPSGFIWSILQRKDANRKLVVDEGGLSVSQFDSLNAAYQGLYETEKKSKEDAQEKLEENDKIMQASQDQYRELATQMYNLRDLFQQVVREAGVQLTAEQREKFEATRPKRFISPTK